ncbi:hypothetical protein SBBP2_1720007 [Burkholderiales bacterium]|jgi:hypothetical protein|nr:hypothetical protein SBBP2_1720007 [Burkholderiales bacterium]
MRIAMYIIGFVVAAFGGRLEGMAQCQLVGRKPRPSLHFIRNWRRG